MAMIGGPEGVVAIVAVFGTGAFIFHSIKEAYLKRLEITRGAGTQALGRDVAERLERIEQAVDAIAIEMERVSEGQRFTTRLLAERSSPAVHAPRE